MEAGVTDHICLRSGSRCRVGVSCAEAGSGRRAGSALPFLPQEENRIGVLTGRGSKPLLEADVTLVQTKVEKMAVSMLRLHYQLGDLLQILDFPRNDRTMDIN